jgi:hypothetical protein
VDAVPANRLAALARYGLAAIAPALRDLAEPRRTATLLATARHLEAAAVDDALDLFDVLMATRLISTARRISAAERLAVMPRLERASVTLASTAKALLAALDVGGAWLDVTAAWSAVGRAGRHGQRNPGQAVPAARLRVLEPVHAWADAQLAGQQPDLETLSLQPGPALSQDLLGLGLGQQAQHHERVRHCLRAERDTRQRPTAPRRAQRGPASREGKPQDHPRT